jgi:hypothetical protein
VSAWDSYPTNYREAEVQTILTAVHAGECASVIGLSGAGKSNLLGFLAQRVSDGPGFLLVDCNDLPAANADSLLAKLVEALGGEALPHPSIRELAELVQKRLVDQPGGLCFLLDRFDPFIASALVASNLRSLRDRFKYKVTYVTATRAPLDPGSELAELFFAHTFWLGALSRADALWSIQQYAQRNGVDWDDATMESIFELSAGYPSMLRAVCESYAAGTPLELLAMREALPVKRRVAEFWFDAPSEEALRQSGLEDHLLLQLPPQPNELTAAEKRLLDTLSAHEGEVCSKEMLITAVWPEEKLTAGLRDDSLTQLVHRLREKINTDGKEHIQTVSGRGYRYHE